MLAAVISERFWSPCGGPIGLPPNPALERTSRLRASSSDTVGAAGYSA